MLTHETRTPLDYRNFFSQPSPPPRGLKTSDAFCKNVRIGVCREMTLISRQTPMRSLWVITSGIGEIGRPMLDGTVISSELGDVMSLVITYMTNVIAPCLYLL